MLMFGVVWVSLMWMYFTEVRPVHAQREQELQLPPAPATGPI
jgi:NNP family nitrate/nitrite transporter-like MFS transporter